MVERSGMTTTLANQLRRINLANGGLKQTAQVVTLKSGPQNARSVDSSTPSEPVCGRLGSASDTTGPENLCAMKAANSLNAKCRVVVVPEPRMTHQILLCIQ